MAATQELATEQALVIAHDLEPGEGPVESATDVIVEGTVRSGSSVQTKGSLRVRGAVEAASVRADGDVHIEGGITGKGTGQITAGGSLTTRFCDEANLKAGGDVVVTAGGVVHSHIETMGRLLVEHGGVVGGQLYAREGAVIKTLGTESQIKTQVAVGIRPEVLAGGDRLEKAQRKQRENVQRIRDMVQPLLANLKRLTPQLRERATEMMYQADGIDAQIQEEARRQAEALAACTPKGDASLLVTERVFAGALLIFGDRCFSMTQEREGPVRFNRRQVRNKTEILLEEVNTSTVSTLVSAEYAPEPSGGESKTTEKPG